MAYLAAASQTEPSPSRSKTASAPAQASSQLSSAARRSLRCQKLPLTPAASLGREPDPQLLSALVPSASALLSSGTSAGWRPLPPALALASSAAVSASV